jgi:hypothetical protein
MPDGQHHTPASCIQAGPTAANTIAVKMISETLGRMATQQERVITALETIAEQGAEIISLKDESNTRKKETANLFLRMTAVEVAAAGERVRLGFIVAGASVVGSATTGVIIKLLIGL